MNTPLPPDRLRALAFAEFSAINRQRCESPDGFNHRLDSWSLSDWFTAILGELGEAANVAKKLNRYRDGIPGNKESEATLHDKLRQELGDAFVYLDLLCQHQGFNIGSAAVEVFNAKSHEIGCPILVREPPPQEQNNGDVQDRGSAPDRGISATPGLRSDPGDAAQVAPAHSLPDLLARLDAVAPAIAAVKLFWSMARYWSDEVKEIAAGLRADLAQCQHKNDRQAAIIADFSGQLAQCQQEREALRAAVVGTEDVSFAAVIAQACVHRIANEQFQRSQDELNLKRAEAAEQQLARLGSERIQRAFELHHALGTLPSGDMFQRIQELRAAEQQLKEPAAQTETTE